MAPHLSHVRRLALLVASLAQPVVAGDAAALTALLSLLHVQSAPGNARLAAQLVLLHACAALASTLSATTPFLESAVAALVASCHADVLVGSKHGMQVPEPAVDAALAAAGVAPVFGVPLALLARAVEYVASPLRASAASVTAAAVVPSSAVVCGILAALVSALPEAAVSEPLALALYTAIVSARRARLYAVSLQLFLQKHTREQPLEFLTRAAHAGLGPVVTARSVLLLATAAKAMGHAEWLAVLPVALVAAADANKPVREAGVALLVTAAAVQSKPTSDADSFAAVVDHLLRGKDALVNDARAVVRRVTEALVNAPKTAIALTKAAIALPAMDTAVKLLAVLEVVPGGARLPAFLPTLTTLVNTASQKVRQRNFNCFLPPLNYFVWFFCSFVVGFGGAVGG